jgi:hypothetical protein
MPYTTAPHMNNFEPTDPLPQHLQHKLLYALPYQRFDGIDPDDTDMR